MDEEPFVISEGPTRLELAYAGTSFEEHINDHLMRITLRSGSLSGSVTALPRFVDHFVAEIDAMRQSLTGKASLEFWDHQHSLTLEIDKFGHVHLTVDLVDHGRLCVPIEIDQSYLPQMVSELTRLFATR